MNIFSDERVVMTLDAGGTNFVFSAIQKGEPVTADIIKASNANNLDLCIQTIKDGFDEVKSKLATDPVAVSFAFPGPADYPKGIIGDLNNLPAFRGGIPLGPILEDYLKLPVFINNDGDLFAYGEALGGILPEINTKLKESGSSKVYKNLIGLTLGTGFGAGLVRNNQLFIGDNSTAAEVWLFSSRKNSEVNVEDLVSTRAVQKVYSEKVNTSLPGNLMPKDIYDIAMGNKKGDRAAALFAYSETGKALGDTIANLMTFIDGVVVIGGGITGAKDLYMPSVMEEIRSDFHPAKGEKLPRLVQKIFNLDDEKESLEFYKNFSKVLQVPGTSKSVTYDPIPRLAVATSRLGASKAISLGAYAFALTELG